MSIEKQVDNLIARQLRVATARLTPQTDLRRDLHCDERKLVELVVALEDEFGIEIERHQAERFRKVGDAYSLVASNSNAA